MPTRWDHVKPVRDYSIVDARGCMISRKPQLLPPPMPEPKKVGRAPAKIALQWARLNHAFRPMSFELVYERGQIAVAPSPWSLTVVRRAVGTIVRNVSDRKTPWVARWRIKDDCNTGRFPSFKGAILWMQKDISRVHPNTFKFHQHR